MKNKPLRNKPTRTGSSRVKILALIGVFFIAYFFKSFREIL